MKRLPPSATNPDQAAGLAAARKVKLFKKGAFEIDAKCFKSTENPANPGMHLLVYMQLPGGSILQSQEDSTGSNGFSDGTEGPDDLGVFEVTSFAGPGNPGTLNVADEDERPFYAVSGKKFLEGSIFGGTRIGNPPAGNGPFGPGEGCIVGGTVRTG